ncbi:MAG: hypothetical protein K6E76_06175 [Patescibacteria group bacterium]|nr:hypothetical protein [Patescibacteria group bacterium]
MLPAKELTVKSEVKGQVGGFLVTQGQQVQGGQPVIQMNDVFYLYDQKVDDAKSTYDTAEFLYNEKVKDEEQQENLLKQEISTLANQLNTTENELFSLSEMTAEYQTTKQQQAKTKNEDFIVRMIEK